MEAFTWDAGNPEGTSGIVAVRVVVISTVDFRPRIHIVIDLNDRKDVQ